MKKLIGKLTDVPSNLKPRVVFDQSLYVKSAIDTLLHEGGVGLLLTALMVLIFHQQHAFHGGCFSLGSAICVGCHHWPLFSAAVRVNSMVLAGRGGVVFSRAIDGAVIVLENIFRHLELGESPEVAAERGGHEVSLAVLAATLTSAVVFFPVTFLYGVSRFLFSALAVAVVLALFASYIVAMTVVPLFCARFIKSPSHVTAVEDGSAPAPGLTGERRRGVIAWGERFNERFGHLFHQFLELYEKYVRRALERAGEADCVGNLGVVRTESRAVSLSWFGILS